MAKVTGQLQGIITKTFNNGGSAVFIKVNNTEYKFGKFPPKNVNEGDWVEFEATSTQNGNYTNHAADYKTFRKSAAGAGAAPNPSPAPMTPARGGGSFGDDRQEIISKQAALNTGFNVFSKMVELGAISPPSSVKKAMLYDFYMNAFHNEAARSYKLSTGKDWDIAEANKPAAEPDDFDDELPGEDSPGW